MNLQFDRDEKAVIHYLKKNGLTELEARIYTAILCRQYHYPRINFVKLFGYHQSGSATGSHPVETIDSSIDNLLKRGLLETIDGAKGDKLRACNPWKRTLEEKLLNNQGVNLRIDRIISSSLERLSEQEKKLIERLGRATWEKPRTSFREAIGEAKQKIRLGVYSSITVYSEIEKEIKKAWVEHQQMEVQILMFSPKLAAKIERNPDLAKDVEDRTRAWKSLYAEAKKEARIFGHKPKLEIRHLHDEEMTAFHRVVLVDEGRWILNVHRTGVERGIEGIVYQGSCENRCHSNLYNLLDHYWRAAWESGVDPSLPKRMLHQLRRYRHFMILITLIGFAWYAHKNQVDWGGLNKDWWGGGIVGLVLAELYKDGSKLTQDILNGLKWLLEIPQNLLTSRK
jgi:hypothetical protein